MGTTTQGINIPNIDYLTLFATIFIAILGWIFALWLQRSNAKYEHQIQVKYDIYKELLKSGQETQNKLHKLSAVSSPFILMKSSMISFELNLTKEYKGLFIPVTEQECLFEGEQKWSKFVQSIFSDYFAFTNQYIEMLYIFGGWSAAIEPLIKTQTAFAKEMDILRERVKLATDNLQFYSSKHGHDWRTWNRDELESYISQIRDDSYTMGTYLGDFMSLIHNELLSKYFDYQKPVRKTLDPKYKVFTENGLVERVDTEMVKKMVGFKKDLTKVVSSKVEETDREGGYISDEYKEFLVSIENGICPDCKNPIDVLEAKTESDSFSFRYTCGHGWKGITIREEISVKESLKMVVKHFGFGKIRTIIQGWRSSGDKNLPKGVDYYMDADKGKNEYHQIVKNTETKEILHEEHEPLTEHHHKIKY